MSFPRNFLENPDTCIDGNILERVTVTKFLGVMLDEKLLWKSHIEYILTKLAKSIGILVRARRILDQNALSTLYNSLVLPYFIYCIIIWGNTYKTYCQRLHVMQKKIIRIISHSEYNAHTEPLFRKLKILTFYQLYDYFTGIFIYKSLNGLLPRIFHNIFVPNKTSRNRLDLRPGFCTRKTSEFTIRITGPKIWNKLSKNIKLSKSINSFKYKLKRELLMSR